MEAISKTPLKDAVFAPPVVRQYSSKRVLTTKWIDGEKLDSSSSSDVAALCSVAMNTYLTMMLECSILHCDPHPGNLKRTPDGRLCILDWGLVTVLQPDLQLSYQFSYHQCIRNCVCWNSRVYATLFHRTRVWKVKYRKFHPFISP